MRLASCNHIPVIEETAGDEFCRRISFGVGARLSRPFPYLQKYADVFRRQHRLIQNNRTAGDLEGAVRAAQNILPFTDKKILIGFHARTVDNKIRINFDGAAVVLFDSDIGY